MKRGIIIMIIVVIVGTVMILANKENDDFIKSCTEAGYTKEYCEIHK